LSAALLVGLCGVALIVSAKTADGVRVVAPVGAWVLGFGTFCWAFGSIFSRTATRPDLRTTFMGMAIQMLVAGCVLGVVSVISGDVRHFSWNAVSGRSVLAWGYLIVAGSWIGYSAYIWLLQVCNPARVGTYAYVNPVVAILLGYWIGKEPLPPTLLAASVLIIVSVIAVTRSSGRKSFVSREPQTEKIAVIDPAEKT
jgi:drug/metabolite transporter (DMT)-like permease